ncbi:VWA domain-containing protein [Desulfovibrio litoralis]|uniref:Cobalamin biosynthesis protein CobT n=1 Tax=Desulfovibrio litoralis DSM 11393 TaxID=1121455 RepID=A0A1M7TPQ8_9BACT|nr:VWA domain-containing protein [Desulfovibrio litoralis]SHN72731.1 Cobalamin biosynthesis protein CobT [Desulfovibrio litoralis DSM 11393]
MKNKDIINALPLVAGILGRKYGINVEIGGETAYTDGNTIYLPDLPIDSDANLLGFARSFLDHEAAHIRETDFNALKVNKLDMLEKHIWNILEDYRVEHKLANIFPGCRHNFNWLIKKIFLEEYNLTTKQANSLETLSGVDTSQNTEAHITQDLLNWMLLKVRSWDVPELQANVCKLENNINSSLPDLLSKLELVLATVPTSCKNTQDCILIAKELVKILKKYLKSIEVQDQEKAGLTSSGVKDTSIEALKALLSNNLVLPDDLSTSIAKELSRVSRCPKDTYSVAIETQKSSIKLSSESIARAKMTSTALRTRLQALLQSNVNAKNRLGYTGRLNNQQIHRLSIGNAKIFKRQGIKQGVDTAVHILIDSSGSMHSELALASESCFAVASALYSLPKVKVAVTSFPGEMVATPKGDKSYISVGTILKHGEKLHNKFRISANGGTPMAEALWWTFQKMQALPEKRKIILLITDGKPDFITATEQAIRTAQHINVEVYGIGIGDNTIQALLPDTSQYIDNINNLVPVMFQLLQKALVRFR